MVGDVRVAAWQAPLLPTGSMDALDLIRARVEWCEAEGVSILCCPEAILGGLADNAEDPAQFAIAVGDHLESVLAQVASKRVTTILGFTEFADGGRLHNSAAVYERGAVTGIYRKLHPALNRSVYAAGSGVPVFVVGDLTFGIVLCDDSNYVEPARRMAAQGATVLFVPTNNSLPQGKAGPEIVAEARDVDIAGAVENSMWVIRADVAGCNDELVSYGSSGIVDTRGTVVRSAQQLSEDLLVAEIDTAAGSTRSQGYSTT